MLENLKKINNVLIETNFNDEKELKKQLLIKEILKKENCFLKMNMKYAFSILRDLKIDEENVKDVYCKLIKL